MPGLQRYITCIVKKSPYHPYDVRELCFYLETSAAEKAFATQSSSSIAYFLLYTDQDRGYCGVGKKGN